jgi:hypothetical protein
MGGASSETGGGGFSLLSAGALAPRKGWVLNNLAEVTVDSSLLWPCGWGIAAGASHWGTAGVPVLRVALEEAVSGRVDAAVGGRVDACEGDDEEGRLALFFHSLCSLGSSESKLSPDLTSCSLSY